MTLSRLPLVTAADLDEEGKRHLAARTFTPGPADCDGVLVLNLLHAKEIGLRPAAD